MFSKRRRKLDIFQTVKWEEMNEVLTAAYFSNLRFQNANKSTRVVSYYHKHLMFRHFKGVISTRKRLKSKAYQIPNDTIKEFPADEENKKH